MLPKQYRLKNSKAFSATYNNKNVVGNRYCVLYRGREKNDEMFVTKVGFVVGKKYHKRAVKRNHIKRLFRAAYQNLLKENKIAKAQKYMSLVFVIKNDCLDINYDKCYEIMLKLLNL